MTRAITAALIVFTALVTAALAPGCDRIVNLTPFYDAQPEMDGRPADGGFALDAGPRDGSGAPGDGATDDGLVAPSDGDGLPGNGDAFPGDGNTAFDGAIARAP